MVRRIDTTTGVVSTLAGNMNLAGNIDGVGIMSSFTKPISIAMDAAGIFALVVSSSVLFVLCFYFSCLQPVLVLLCLLLRAGRRLV